MTVSGSDSKQAERLLREARCSLAARIDALRRAHDYSLIFLADAAQVGRGHLSNILACKANVTLETLAKLAYALEVDLADLLKPGASAKPALARGRPRTRRVVRSKRSG